ncbi:FRG domain-containing protein [Candidatus Poribacteria bacterium]|nr:FRG domain-containing protein [Candidatus Poribacteria bacterium]
MTGSIKIKSWDKLVSFFMERSPDIYMAWRGQAKKYDKMNARIDRCLNEPDLGKRLRKERAVCQRFREHAPIYLSAVEHRYLTTRWLQLVVMQHYGAPTRLLDWTKSPWVAAFFAVSDGWESDGYMYGFPRNKLEDCIREKFDGQLNDLVWGRQPNDMKFPDEEWDLAKANDKLFDPGNVKNLSKWVATYYCREAHFPRLVAQQGLFTFGSKPDLDHWKQICSLLQEDCDDFFEVQIKSEAKLEVLRGLNNVGLNGATLFPGPDGIGKSLEGFARAWPPPP